MKSRNKLNDENLAEILYRHIGETVTIYTTGGGMSGKGFTGVILSVNRYIVRLITRVGGAPGLSYGSYYTYRYGRCGSGSICDIPIDHIVSFVHNMV